MYKKTSTIKALVITTILTAYISALVLSNQAFAQQDEKGNIGSAAQAPIHFLGKILAEHEDLGLGGDNRMIPPDHNVHFQFPGFGPLQDCLSSKWIHC
jgi:hypothetical protein